MSDNNKMSDHTVKAFSEQLESLSSGVAQMGGLAEAQLADAVEAIARRDTKLAEGAIAGDPRIDTLQQEIEAQALKLLALRQPMAVDLRVVLSSIKIAAALERIADYAKNTAKRSMVLAQSTAPAAAVSGIDRLGRLGRLGRRRALRGSRFPSGYGGARPLLPGGRVGGGPAGLQLGPRGQRLPDGDLAQHLVGVAEADPGLLQHHQQPVQGHLVGGLRGRLTRSIGRGCR